MAKTASTSQPLTPSESALWRAFLRATVVVPRELGAELEEAERLSANEFGVLVLLSEAPEQRATIGALAEHTALTISGMTRIIDRLARDELVKRVRCNEDGRSFYAVLTTHGANRLRRAQPTVDAIVRRHIINNLAGFDLVALTAALTRFGQA